MTEPQFTDRSKVRYTPEKCDYCNEENDILFVKPRFMKVKGTVYTSNQRKPLWTCLGCYMDELQLLEDEQE